MWRCVVTGGAGFIGSALVERLLERPDTHVLTIDKLTYAGNKASLAGALASPRHDFLHADIADAHAIAGAFARFQPDAVFNLAAETHVDRSITGPTPFIHTNVSGVASLLQVALEYYRACSADAQARFRFLHISTDEVFGALGEDGAFTETTPYAPNSPYSASKAGGDHLVRAWHKTYGLPTIITNCSNNYGPRQFPEKLIPLMLMSALHRRPLPVYGDGRNVRDWIYVEDHIDGLIAAAVRGIPGGRYLFGGRSEARNIELVHALCRELHAQKPCENASGYEGQITFVEDRQGHDYRYAVDDSVTRTALEWAPRHDLEAGLRDTIAWYLANEEWWRPLLKRTPIGD